MEAVGHEGDHHGKETLLKNLGTRRRFAPPNTTEDSAVICDEILLNDATKAKLTVPANVFDQYKFPRSETLWQKICQIFRK